MYEERIYKGILGVIDFRKHDIYDIYHIYHIYDRYEAYL